MAKDKQLPKYVLRVCSRRETQLQRKVNRGQVAADPWDAAWLDTVRLFSLSLSAHCQTNRRWGLTGYQNCSAKSHIKSVNVSDRASLCHWRFLA